MPLRIRGSLLLAAVLMSSVACARPQASTCTGRDEQLVEPKKLRVGTDLEYPPFGMENPKSHESTGFEIDLVREIARDLHLELVVVNRTSSALIPALLAHRHDLDASGFVDTADFRSLLCTSLPYLDADLGLGVRTGDASISGPGDLAAHVVGVVRGGRSQEWTHVHVGRSTRVAPFETFEDLLAALQARRVDAAIEELPVMRYALRDVKDVSIASVISTGRHYVLAANPANGGLMAKANRTIQKFQINGTLRKLKKKWFGG